MSVDSACFPISLVTALIWNHWFPRKVSIQHSPGLRASDKLQEKPRCTWKCMYKRIRSSMSAVHAHTLECRRVCAHTLVYSYKSKLQPLSCHVYCLKSEVIQSAAWLMNWLEKSTANYPDLSLSQRWLEWKRVAWMQISPPQVCCWRRLPVC